jgi:adenosylcobinamide-GDP ribazoletransferase
VSGLLVALRYLTVVPIPGPAHEPLERLGRAAGWFPVVGLLLGVVLVVVDAVTAWIFPPLLAALLTLTAWKLLTGGLHLDGLADCLDGLTGRDAEHRLAIMRDSRIGAFGAMGLILLLMLDLVALSEIPSATRWQALLAAPVVARAAPAALADAFRPARPGGQGAAFRAGLTRPRVLAALGVALGVSAVFGGGSVAGFLVAVVGALALGGLVARRLGGVTGDVHGAAVEVAELLFLLMAVVWTRRPR